MCRERCLGLPEALIETHTSFHHSHPTKQPGVTQVSWRCSYLVLPSARSAARAKQQPWKGCPLPFHSAMEASWLCGSHTRELSSTGRGKVMLGWAWLNNPAPSSANPSESSGTFMRACHDMNHTGITVNRHQTKAELGVQGSTARACGSGRAAPSCCLHLEL